MIVQIADLYRSYPKEFIRFAKFSIVGAAGTIIDFSLFNLTLYIINYLLGWHLLAQFAINGNLLSANILSFSAGILNNFTWNRIWTFREARSRKKRVQLLQFTAVSLVGLVLNSLIVIGLDIALASYVNESLRYNIAKLVATGIILFWNFGANRLWTFRQT